MGNIKQCENKLRVLVTGAGGFLGRGIVRELIDRGLDIVATDRATDAIDSRACSLAADLFSIDDPYNFFQEPNVLLHLAWRDGFRHYSRAHIDDLPLHYRFIEKMVAAGISRIAVMGSMHEIGFFEGAIREETPCKPVTPYGISKNALRELTEMLCLKYDTPMQWLRGFYIVGDTGSNVFSQISAAERSRKKEFPFTQGKNQFDFIEYDLFCSMVADVIMQDKINGIINVCSGYPKRIGERVEQFIHDNDYQIKLKYGEYPERPYDSKAVWGDDTKIREIMKNSKQ